MELTSYLIVGVIFFTGLLLSPPAAASEDTTKPAPFDISAMSPHCMNDKPTLTSNYVPTGTNFTLPSRELLVYEAKPTNETVTEKILIAVYDIFGFHPNTQQVLDQIATVGRFRVIMPDFLRGGWPLSNDIPVRNTTAFQEFLTRNGSWEIIGRDIRELVKYYKDKEPGVHFGIMGFCWGGKISVMAASEIEDIGAGGLVHPSFVNMADANLVQAPIYLLPSKNEPDLVPFYNILVTKFGKEKVGHKRFDDMIHGFAAARGNFDDPNNRDAVEQVIEILSKYFNQRLSK